MENLNKILIGIIISIISAVVGIFIRKDSLKQKIKDFIKKYIRKYYKTISSADYLLWQNELLKKYYKGYFSNIDNVDFPVYIYYSNTNTNTCSCSFENLFNKDKLVKREKIDFTKIKHYKKYKKLQENSMLPTEERKVRYPKRKCFLLDEIKLVNNHINSFTAYIGNYEDNVYSSFILDYENYLLYKKYGNRSLTEKLYNKIKKKMIIRNNIHNNKHIDDVLSTGCNRASMFAVQLAIMAKDSTDNKYKIIIGKRSDNVATRPGFYQFVPAGAFEIYGNEDENDFEDIRVINQCSVELTIFREYLEEIFGRDDAEDQKKGETLYKLLENNEVKRIKKMIDDEKTAHLEFLGSVVSLVDLRHLLSFAIRIDDVKYSKEVFGNIQSNKQKELCNVKPIRFSDFLRIEKMKLHPSSAALYKLLTESSLYKEVEEFGID